MKYYVPDYYKDFACIAGACRHSCCKGWEIDVDDNAMQRWASLPEPWHGRIAGNIAVDEAGAHFVLTEDERCPFLKSDGLCELILNLGEDSLCQICADHPRFRSFLSDRTETGLGLCCEAAGRLILGRQEKVSLVLTGDDGKEDLLSADDAQILSLREEVLSVAQDRTLPVRQRAGKIAALCGAARNRSGKEIAGMLLELEIMDEEWRELLKRLAAEEDELLPVWQPELETVFEQLLVYFLFRHIPEACDVKEALEYAGFCIFSYDVICALCALRQREAGVLTFEELVNICRLYSSEIEYSDENTGLIIERLQQM